jgi:hypothetical protein
MLPPFTIQSEENRAMARHCSIGIEPRISSERIILLDTQVLSVITKLHCSNMFYFLLICVFIHFFFVFVAGI